jgi:hypothetical protein
VLEFVPTAFVVTGCFGSAPALDRIATRGEAALRVALDELLLLGELRTSDLAGDDLLVVDLTSAFAAYTLRGTEVHEAFCRLSAIPLKDEGTLQGLVAGVPAKVLVRDHELLLLVSSVVSHYVENRVRTACADLFVVETPTTPATEEAAA